MKPTTLLRSLALAALCSAATTSGVLAQQTRSVSGFQTIRASGAINVFLKQGASTEVKVDAPAELLDRIKTEVQGSTLSIYREKGLSMLLSNQKVNVYITCPTLTGVEVSGASDVKSTTPFTADEFTIRASGASDVTMTINAKTLTATASGASDLRLTGRVERQQVQVSGSSDYQGYNLQSRTATVQASGASDAYVAVTDELSSHASGSSDIHYKGKPRVTK
ncbi:head GIN domain-containing protein [Hymenobacter glacieicola]|uniref:head GIN domain-containing protein n=1 Tax=Hymenobacter glacieicola TaxID=1562124 RepID=UPI00166599CB|nr:head GIN domain-containing protein [Hymenobacter glacieicola]